MTVYQRPNALLIIAIALSIISHFLHQRMGIVVSAAATVTWICWAFDELRYGVNWFRRVLGAVVMAWQFIGLLR